MEITKNLVFLTENLCNLRRVLTHCMESDIISKIEKEWIMGGETSFDKTDRYFDVLMKRNWEDIKNKIIRIFRETSNNHCANKKEGVEIHRQKQTTSEKRKIKKLLYSKWWPEVKYLPKSFVERKEYDTKLIDILKDNLTKSKIRSTNINQGAVVSGKGGVGKTTIAKWFAIHFQDTYNHIIWIDSGNDSLPKSFRGLATELKVDTNLELKLMAKECYDILEKAKCLFIFDNAECYQGHLGIGDILPKHDNFDTIITSRNIEIGNESVDAKIPEIHLNTFATSESIEYLTKNLEDNTSHKTEQLIKLSEQLGNLPLALQLAVITINSNNLCIDKYIEGVAATGHVDSHLDDYEQTINKTMKISLDIIKNHKEDPKQIAHQILLTLGYVKPDNVEFVFLQATNKLSEFETTEAVELLKIYCLITTHSNLNGKFESCSIHRLLQQFIRLNNKEEKVTLTKILSVEGFLDYKLIPFDHADEEIQSLFPQIGAQLIYQKELEVLLDQRRFKEAVELSRKIKMIIMTPVADYNYAVCLEKMNEWVDPEPVLQSLCNYLLSNENTEIDDDTWYDRIQHNIKENGLWNLEVQMEPEIVRGLLFVIYSKLKKDDKAHEIINQGCQLITFTSRQHLDYVIRFLRGPSKCDYLLENTVGFLFLQLGNNNNRNKKISLKECSLSERFPNRLNHLSLEDVVMLDGGGRSLTEYDISTLISNNLKLLRIKCCNSTKFKIQINHNLQSCYSIDLENCIILLSNGSRLTPTEIAARKVSFIKNDDEIENVCLNDWIDFRQTKKLTLEGRNMSMMLDNTLNMDEIALFDFGSLNWNDFICTVKYFTVWNTHIPCLGNNIALRMNKLRLQSCSIHLTSLFFLSKSASEIILKNCTIEIDEVCIERNMKIFAADVELSYIKFTQNSEEVSKIPLDIILDLTEVKRLSVENGEGTTLTFDVSQQFFIDYLNFKGVQILNWNESSSTVKTLKLRDVVLRGISSCQFKVLETLNIWNSVVDFTSLHNISASSLEVVLTSTILHLDSSLIKNELKLQSHINDQGKKILLDKITFIDDGEEIEYLLFNNVIDITPLNSLHIRRNMKGNSRIRLDMANISLSLQTLSLKNVTVLNWDKGQGHVQEMRFIGIPFMKRNFIKIDTIEFGGSSIDLSCLPENIQRIHLTENTAVTCKAPVEKETFKNLNCVILDCDPFAMKYFSHCPVLAKVELKYSVEDEFLLNFLWIPKSIETLKIIWGNVFSPPPSLNITSTGNRRFKLKLLIIQNFFLSGIEHTLQVLQPKKVIIYELYPMRLTNEEASTVVKLIESHQWIAIGKIQWKSNAHFQNCPLSKFVDKRGEFYVFENQRGEVLQKTEFVEMTTL